MASLGKTCASCGGQYGPEVLFCPLDGTPLGSGRTLANSPSEIDPYLDLELSGQIKLNALVGIGSMGRVYRAFQSGVDRDVAVKILHRELTGNLELVARFHREAKIASRLVHPNVVQVLMTGTLPPSTD
ncbi:MAG: protein kinase, partial [Myxococcales bacterium]|nr:protein kinase [Myxococcales bacterium]